MDAFRDMPAIGQEIAIGDEATLGRMAHVVEVDGHSVRLRFPEDGPSGGPAWYPATVVGLPVGSHGVLIPTRGNGALFVPVGQSYSKADVDWLLAQRVPIPKPLHRADKFTTTALTGTPIIVEQLYTDLSPSAWYRYSVTTSSVVSRSVNTGAVIFGLTVYGMDGGGLRETYMDLATVDTVQALTRLQVSAEGMIKADTLGQLGFGIYVRGAHTAGTTAARSTDGLLTLYRA